MSGGELYASGVLILDLGVWRATIVRGGPRRDEVWRCTHAHHGLRLARACATRELARRVAT